MIRSRKVVGRIAMAGLATLSLGTSLRAELLVNNWRLTSEALVTDTEGVVQSDSVIQNAGGDNPAPVLPFTQTDTAVAVVGISDSSSTYNFSRTGDNGTFSFGFDHRTAASFDSFASSDGTIVFTPAVDSTFALTGAYSPTGPGSPLVDVSLSEFGSGASLFDNALALTFTNETGSLQAGVTYRLLYEFRIDGTGGSEATTAGGNLTMTLLAPQSVAIPAPPAVALALVGFAIVGLRRRRTI